MPLGDSITRGSAGSYNSKGKHITIGFRGPLFNSLKNAGYNIDFVGSRTDGPPSIPYLGVPQYYDYDNEGHSGWEAAESTSDPYYPAYDMLSNLKGFLNENPPDIILIHLGTNDLETGQSPTGVANDISSLLDSIYTFNPNIVVFLAKIINRGNQVFSADSGGFDYDGSSDSFNDTYAPPGIRNTTKVYNNLLGELASQRIINNDKLVLVNMENAISNYNEDTSAASGFPYGELWDSFHPNQAGYNELANVWFSALNKYFKGIPVLANPLKDSSGLTLPITLTWGITSNATGYIVQVSKDSNFTSDSLIYNNYLTKRHVTINSSNTNGLGYGEKYYWRVAGENIYGQTFYSDVWNFVTKSMQVAIRVFMEGPYAGGDSMLTTLNKNHFIPAAQPYNVAPWNYSGTEVDSTIPPGVVDWVLVQLRTGTSSSTTIAERAAFLDKNGYIVDLDGVSPLKFKGVEPGNYYLVVEHRNHLPIMSADTISLPSTNIYDFTKSKTSTYGNNALIDLGGGSFGMIAGDNDGDKVISVNDYNSIAHNFFHTGYYNSDDNMDGVVSSADYNYVSGNLFKYSFVP